MADNYLEKRMADYRAGRLSAPRGASSKKAPSYGALTIKYAKTRALIAVPPEVPPANIERLTALARTLRGVDFQVALSGADAAGQALAQRYGLRFYPSKILRADLLADLSKRWGGVDVTISCFGAPVAQDGIELTYPADADADAVSRALLFMLHPDNKDLIKHFDIIKSTTMR